MKYIDELVSILETKPRSMNMEKFISINASHIYKEILKISFPEDFTFTQKVWHYIHNDPECLLGICECGNRCGFKSLNRGYYGYCSIQCMENSNIIKEKKKNTLCETFGSIENARKMCGEKCKNILHSKSKEEWDEINIKRKNTNSLKTIEEYKKIYEKIQKTKMSKSQEERQSWIEKQKETFRNKSEEEKQAIVLKRLNTYNSKTEEEKQAIKDKLSNTFKCKSKEEISLIYEKQRETNQKRYGVDWYVISPDFLQKSQETCIKNHNAKNFSQSEDYQECVNDIHNKILKTKQKNKSFNNPKQEDNFERYLIESGYSYVRQYKEERYPYACDFYFPDYDLFLEIQGHWSHGPHPFNENDDKDIELLDKWIKKSGKIKSYENSIDVWTRRDVEKRKTAKDNHLFFVEIFSDDINLIIEKFINTISKYK